METETDDDEHDCIGYCVEVGPDLFECAACGLRYDTADLQKPAHTAAIGTPE